MVVELINTGSELLLGRVLNTHQLWICRQLSDHGYSVQRQIAVPDTASAIEQAVRESLRRADIVLTTGGLGPTSDDLTRERIAELLGRPLEVDRATLLQIQQFFAARGRPIPARVELQAQVPRGARILANHHGTAPGLILELRTNPFHPQRRPAWIVMLPGPPRELRPMFANDVLPFLAEQAPPPNPPVFLTFRTTGIGESLVEERLAPLLQPCFDRGLQIGYCARPGEVDIRIAAAGPEAPALLADASAAIRTEVGAHIYTEAEEELENAVVNLLRQRCETLAVAESCTGGLLGHRITAVPGASEAFLGGWITYTNRLKHQLLGVDPNLLQTHGAVSEPVALAMADGARRRSDSDYALAITGIAGPTGGTPEKPVGTVYIALATAVDTHCLHRFNPSDRTTFRQMCTQQALELLRRQLLDRPSLRASQPQNESR